MAGDRPGNLPVETTSLIGRQAELAQIIGLVERTRLVTLTGAGGVGKSRLAVRAAAETRSRFPDGVWLVPLSPLRDGVLMAHTIGDVLGLATQTTRSVDEMLCAYLAERRLLLILDTCEHLIDMSAAMADTLLEEAPGVTILATSRRPLEVPGEHVFPVEPLPVPGPAEAGDRRDDAVALFSARAAHFAPGSDVTRQSPAAVARLCGRLDGIPLAIELAAARLRDLSFDQLSERLADRFEVLADERHASPPRHQTMRTAIGWSHELCEPLERLLWARASVFAGDFDAAAAEKVCADRRLPAGLIVELLLGLVDKSILTCVHTRLGPRYRMLDTIREYGAGWLRTLGGERDLRLRHRNHYLALARQGAAEWLGPNQFTWYDRMNAEHANLRAALDFSLAEPDGHTALELAGSLWFFWYCCGFLKEGQHYLELALAADPRPGPARNRAMWACAWTLLLQGDLGTGRARAAECLVVAEQQGDADAAANALAVMQSAATMRGDLAEMVSLSERLLSAYRREGDLLLPTLVGRLAQSHRHIFAGRPDDAIDLLAQMRAACDRHGERWMRSICDIVGGQAELARGRPDAAQAYGRAALEAKHRLHDHTGCALALDVLAAAAASVGDGERAAYLLGHAQQVLERVGLPQIGIPEYVAARRAGEKQARETIGDQAYQRAFQAGYAAAEDAGITYALGRPPGNGPTG